MRSFGLLLLLASLQTSHAASLQPVNATITNPTNVGFYIYVPDRLQARPAVLVNPHWCHGSARATFEGTRFARLADAHGFLVIYPQAPRRAGDDACWDVSSRETLAHDAGGDSLGIVNMVRWAVGRYSADAGRIFVAGVSSGAMMTSTLLAAYPDVFAAGSAWAGVPFGCFAAPGTAAYGRWSDDCAAGRVARPGPEWAALARAAYPGYDGWRPKVQIFHGTRDEVLDYRLFGEEVKLWTSLFGFPAEPARTVRDSPLPGWTRSVYGPEGWFEATSAANVSHNIPVQEAVIMEWLDLACTGESCFRWGKGGPGNPSRSSQGQSNRA